MYLKKTFYALLLVAIVAAAGCKKGENPYVTKKKTTTTPIDTTSTNTPVVGNAAFIFNNDIYYVADFTKQTAKRITHDSTTFKRLVKLSHNHSKFAYQDVDGVVVVVDGNGTTLATLSQYTQVKSFDWSPDDKTLYLLNNATMVYYGPDMGLPAITFEGIKPGSTGEVLAASVSMTKDFAYVIHAHSATDGDKYKLIIKPAGGGNFVVFEDDDITFPMDYVSFSTHKQDLVLGYRQTNNASEGQEKVSFFTDLNAAPDFSYGGQGLPNLCTPVYKNGINFMVAGYLSSAGLSYGDAAPAAISLDGDVNKNILLSKYTLPVKTFYTDWK